MCILGRAMRGVHHFHISGRHINVKVLLRQKTCCYPAQSCVFEPRKRNVQPKLHSPRKYFKLSSRQTYFHICADRAATFQATNSFGKVLSARSPSLSPFWLQSFYGEPNQPIRSFDSVQLSVNAVGCSCPLCE